MSETTTNVEIKQDARGWSGTAAISTPAGSARASLGYFASVRELDKAMRARLKTAVPAEVDAAPLLARWSAAVAIELAS